MASAGTSRVPLTSGLSSLGGRYDGLLVDLWGCLHNGIRAWPAAVEALQRFRARGGLVVLLSNAPRTDRAIAGQLETMGVPEDAWDGIMTAGLAARLAVEEKQDPWFAALGPRFWHVGTEKGRNAPGRARPRTGNIGCRGQLRVVLRNPRQRRDARRHHARTRTCSRTRFADAVGQSRQIRPARHGPRDLCRCHRRGLCRARRQRAPGGKTLSRNLIADASTCWEACLPGASSP